MDKTTIEKKVVKTTTNLQYKFKDAELLELGRNLAETRTQLSQLESDFKSVSSEWKSKISACEAKSEALTNKVRDGYEYRDIDCEWTHHDPREGMKTLRRKDTGETLKTVAMTTSELQEDLPLEIVK